MKKTWQATWSAGEAPKAPLDPEPYVALRQTGNHQYEPIEETRSADPNPIAYRYDRVGLRPRRGYSQRVKDYADGS